MSKTDYSLSEVDEVNVTIIMDNIIDVLMKSTGVAHAFQLDENPHERDRPLLIAEHGFSALIEVKQGDKSDQILFDTGVSPTGVLHNVDVMGIDLNGIQAIVLSHGHPDHAMGLPDIIDRLGRKELQLVLHPDALLDRKWTRPDGTSRNLPAPKVADFKRESLKLIKETGPTMLADNMILVSGEIARTTDFEKGFTSHYSMRKDTWEHDPWINDDQCIIVNLRGQGLVIITGCGHAGIINTIFHAQDLTGVREIYAVVGGFHLSGDLFEPIIPRTISELKKINPRYVMPGHCTGWYATHQIAHLMPESFIPNNVGVTLIFQERA